MRCTDRIGGSKTSYGVKFVPTFLGVKKHQLYTIYFQTIWIQGYETHPIYNWIRGGFPWAKYVKRPFKNTPNLKSCGVQNDLRFDEVDIISLSFTHL